MEARGWRILCGGEEVGLFSSIRGGVVLVAHPMVGVCLTFRGLLYILIILNLSRMSFVIRLHPLPSYIKYEFNIFIISSEGTTI